MLNRYLFFQAFLLFLDLYAYQSVRTVSSSNWIRWGYWVLHLGVYVGLAYFAFTVDVQKPQTELRLRAFVGLIFLIYLPKILLFLVLFIEDVLRILVGIFHKWQGTSQTNGFLPERRAFLSKSLLGAAILFEGALLNGYFRGRYDFQVRKVGLKFSRLPKSFEGLKIVHLSDLHIGSFEDQAAVQRGIDLVNAQKPDVIVFTGDMVNNRADEAEAWISLFQGLEAPFGKFSILGNHDYGDYASWENRQEKIDNLNRLKEIHAEMGFELLCNQSKFVEKDAEKIAIVGVENWGTASFSQKYADLNQAFEQISPEDFSILLSHDPSHWRAEILPFQQHIPLTLSGHTHGLQLGVEIGNLKFSPVQWRYPEWAGLYPHESGQQLYVNRGFGFIGLPARVGILPEITVLTLSAT